MSIFDDEKFPKTMSLVSNSSNWNTLNLKPQHAYN